MSDIPAQLLQARKKATTLIENARKTVKTTLDGKKGWSQLSIDSIQRLRELAVTQPRSQQLAELLAEMTPRDSEMWVSMAKIGLVAKPQSLDLGADARMRLLRTAVLDAGLSEQLDADGQLLGNGAEGFSAATLEASLDDWCIHGQHRSSAPDAAQLTQIDIMISKSCPSAEDALHTRLGLLGPVIAAIHIWRLLDTAPEIEAHRLGWVAQPSVAAEVASPTVQ